MWGKDQRRHGHLTTVVACLALLVLMDALLLVATGRAVAEERRVALVVGNSKYRNLGRDLKNPVEDAAAMQVTLHRLGFELIVGQDLALDGFRRKVDEFAAAVRDAEIALLFYAGHGVQFDGQNYLLPTDIEVTSQADMVGKSIALNKVLTDMTSASASIVFLDACRDSPQFRSVSRANGPGMFGFSRGLAPVPASVSDRFIGFAAAPGFTAEDGGRSKNSPFTEALLRHIAKPDIEINAMFTAVRADVMRVTSKRQQPEALNALTQPLYLSKSAGPSGMPQDLAGPDGEEPPSISLSSDAEFWFVIKDTNDPRNFDLYLQQFPKGRFVPLARRKLEQLKFPPPKMADLNTKGGRPIAPDGVTVEGDWATAIAVARVSKDHPKEEALRSARDLARAKVILARVAAAGINLPNSIDSSSYAAEMLGYLSRGLTFEETWTTHQATGKELKVELRAKVRPLVGDTERRLTGSIEPTDVISGQPIRLKLLAKKDATIGVFAWQANGTVLRLYPDSTKKPVMIKAGEPISLPRSGDLYPAIASGNMPGERRNHEALIVVTGGKSLNFEQLVPTLVTEATQHSPTALTDAGDFLSKLAAIEDTELELLVLPYEVRDR
ncbi:MAG TPA: caspase family protein [Hyphomicrobiaceae bacterium]|nr:caspase family protein [Hyphomicrobiaceae bacterium]